MSNLNKVPFGLRVEDDEIVDVCEVPNGSQCGCVCPSCQTPLMARQGDEKDWHFAHDSKNTHQQTKDVCEYSFYTSVRLMARQVIGKQLKLNLPALIGIIEYYQTVRWKADIKEIPVTEARIVILDNLVVETSFSGVAVDIVGAIEGYPFVVYFSHPDRVIPENLYSPANPKCGILEISLHTLFNEFRKLRSENKTYREILIDFLTNNLESKKWIYHPKFKPKAKEALAELRQRPFIIECYAVPLRGRPNPKQLKWLLPDNPSDQADTLTKFHCLQCLTQWEGAKVAGRYCQKCKEYLFTKEFIG